jgi:hypothetical protein
LRIFCNRLFINALLNAKSKTELLHPKCRIVILGRFPSKTYPLTTYHSSNMRLLTLAVIAVTFVLLFGGCRDRILADRCNLSYGRETFYIVSGPVQPILDPNVRGVFAADPDGLAIDPNRGIIVPSQSASGQRYLVKFISLDNRQICETTVIISGINYPIGIYNRSSANPPVIRPFYDANLRSEVPDGARTIFSSGFVGPNQQQSRIALSVDPVGGQLPALEPRTGNINVTQINLQQLFNTTQLTDGLEVTVTIPYQLDDESNAAPNQLRLNFVYYRREQDIPEAVRERLRRQQEQLRAGRVNGEKDHVPPNIIISDQ